jgi:nucleoside-diphosphate-sugar epimerase
MAKYLVTGAAGFIGYALSNRLQAGGHRVHALLHRPATGPWDDSYTVDLRHQLPPGDFLSGVEGIFHCAGAAHFRGLPREQEVALWELNVDATQRLLAAAATAGVKRFVYFSSVQAAGKPGDQCADESWQAPPDNLYGQSKLAAEALVAQTGQDAPMHTAILRPALVYGPGVKGNLQRMLQAIERGRMPALPDSGKQRSMLALDNLVDAACLAMNCDAANGRTYIVCDEQPYSTRWIFEAMHRALGRPLPKHTLPLGLFKLAAHIGDFGNKLTNNAMPWDSAAYERLFGGACYNAARLQTELGWRPATNFAQCLPAMVQAMQTRTDKYR